MVLFCQSGQHFCNSLYVHGTGLEETKEYAGRRLIHNCQLWQAAAVSAATPPLFRPQTVGEDEYIDGSFVANNPSIHALQEANNLWKRSIDYLISIGTGFCQTTPKTGDARLNWSNRQVDLVSETTNAISQVALTCHQNNIYFERLNPEINSSFICDTTSKNDFRDLSKTTLHYLTNNTEQIRRVCQRLIASLLYVSEIKQENEQSAIISIRCRRPIFRVSSLLGGPQWQLAVIPLKGEFQSRVEYGTNSSQNPIATIYLDKITSEIAVRIDVLFGNSGFVISGGFVTLQPPTSRFKLTSPGSFLAQSQLFDGKKSQRPHSTHPQTITSRESSQKLRSQTLDEKLLSKQGDLKIQLEDTKITDFVTPENSNLAPSQIAPPSNNIDPPNYNPYHNNQNKNNNHANPMPQVIQQQQQPMSGNAEESLDQIAERFIKILKKDN